MAGLECRGSSGLRVHAELARIPRAHEAHGTGSVVPGWRSKSLIGFSTVAPRQTVVTSLKSEVRLNSDEKLRCPSCGGVDVRHSQRRGLLDSLMSALHKEPYRCRFCQRRFYRPAVKPTQEEPEP
jgi:hypothetical protein